MQLTERFNEALQFAVQLHAGQVRKVSGEPYVAHLLGVASIALDYGADEDEAIAALLHDAIEDQGRTGRASGTGFGRGNRPAVWAGGGGDCARLHRCRHNSQAALAGAERRFFGQARACFAIDSAGSGGR